MSDTQIRSDARIIKAALNRYPECEYFACKYIQGISTEISVDPHYGPIWDPERVTGPQIFDREQLAAAATLLNNPF